MIDVSIASADSETTIEVALGSASEERALAVVQFAVMCVGLILVLPDIHLARFPHDWFGSAELAARFAFAGLWIAIGIFASSRVIFPPVPISLHFTPHQIGYDSGRPGLLYLCNTYGERLHPVWSRALQKRIRWDLHRRDLDVSNVLLTASHGMLHLQSRSGLLGFGLCIPDQVHDSLCEAIQAWAKAEPSNAPEHASRAFSNGQSTARAG
ncbi:hypothetical protein Poly51_49070 [Rubripirellula tenax]|uniref:Uncharacterized protein n=1 Tax=Rubripirellula tenax TaxID=2528015 RepID=A0A5C6E942_9BACT|nr:hypothetical protein Poly51_55780 [Rubripirellula tenax]TWU49003.1 hypothetical protein Poly51_49070 [Rubripirellula tenax]